jgi:hypothetical protein
MTSVGMRSRKRVGEPFRPAGRQSTTTNDSGSYPHLVVDIRICTVPVKFSSCSMLVRNPEATGGSDANRAALPLVLGIG